MLHVSRERRLIVAAAVAGLCLRLAFGLLYWVGRPLTHDEREYLVLARNIAAGRGFTYDSDSKEPAGAAPQFGRAPGYPLFLASIGAAAPADDGTPVRVKIAQAMLGSCTVLLIGAIAWRAAGPPAGAAAAGLAAVYPSLVWMPAYVLSETLYSLVALGAALALQVAIDRSSSPQAGRAGVSVALAAGALTGAAILVRPAMLFFVPLAIVWLVRRRRFALTLMLLAGVFALVAPWTARNLRVHGRFVLVASEGGVTFWTGNHPLARGEGDLAANPALKQADLAFRERHRGLTAEELEPLYYRDAFAAIARNPLGWVGLIARKAFYTVVPVGPSYALHSTRYRLASVVPYLLLLPFAVAGARRLWRDRRRPVALFLLAASAALMCLVFFPQERFRIPVVDPFLIICAASLAAAPPARRFRAALP